MRWCPCFFVSPPHWCGIHQWLGVAKTSGLVWHSPVAWCGKNQGLKILCDFLVIMICICWSSPPSPNNPRQPQHKVSHVIEQGYVYGYGYGYAYAYGYASAYAYGCGCGRPARMVQDPATHNASTHPIKHKPRTHMPKLNNPTHSPSIVLIDSINRHE